MLSIGETAVRAWQCYQDGDLQQAETLYRYMLAEGHNQLGIVSAQQEKLDQAAANFRHAFDLWPNSPGPLSNLGNVLRSQGKLDEAEDCARQAVQLQPDQPESYNSLGQILMKEGKLDEAQACFRKAVELKPDYVVAHSNLLLCLNYDPHADPDLVFAEHRRWADHHGGAQDTDPTRQRGPAFLNRDPDRPLRIGYVSPDFREHVVAAFTLPILQNHDYGQVQVFCYGEVIQPDAITGTFHRMSHGWRSTCGWNDNQLADVIRNDGIHILVDLAGHTGGHRLRVFAQKPAPVQVTYLGYPATTGLATIDYRLTDAVADPPGETCRYTEELYRLPGCFCCYQPPPFPVEAGPLPALGAGHVTFGSLHDLAKVNVEVIRVWCEVLKAVPSSRLLIFRHTLRGKTVDRFRRQFSEAGISPERVELAHTTDTEPGYFGVYRGVDILLDVFPWNGHGTSCEALWMGVPVVTLSGTRHAGRLSASLLTTLGLEDLITYTPQQYVGSAAKLAGDRERLGQLRSTLRQRMRTSPLCDGQAFTRKLEAAYRTMWQRWCSS